MRFAVALLLLHIAAASGSTQPALEEVPGAVGVSMQPGGVVMATVDTTPVIVYLDARGKTVKAKPASEASSRVGGALQITQRYEGERGTTFRIESTLAINGNSTVLIQQKLSVSKPVKLVRFGGIVVRATGRDKDEALFPGLEYLLDGEESSSTLDITSKDHIRFAPHPNKVTVPLMSVVRDGRMVALMWNPMQKWDGERIRPRPLFSSPNRVDGKGEDHLMGLFLPSIEFGQESRLDANKPYLLQPGKPVMLMARLVVRKADHCIDAIDDWIAAYGLPAPIKPPRSWRDELKLCLEPILAPSSQLKMASRDANALALLGASLLPESDLRSQLLAQAESVATVSDAGRSLRFAYSFGKVRQGLAESQSHANGSIRSQKPDGSWRFYCGKDEMIAGFPRRKLGVQGEAASGIVATQALTILRHARITGDTGALDAGLRALEFLDGFIRPQAAQVWEVPVHAPDIFASARCAQSYLEAYRITSDQHYLDKAIYWARTGLPFVYFWNAPDRPIMKFGSIAIFGSSIFVVPWFGRPVQWNGVAYAQALYELSRFDKSFNWRAIADGITANCAQQHITEPGEQYGYYPDWIDVVSGTTGGAPWIPSTQFLLDDVLHVLGVQPDMDTVVIRTDNGRVHISAPAKLDAALSIEKRELAISLDTPVDSRPVSLTVAGLGAPSSVVFNAVSIERGETDGPGMWTHSDGVLVVTPSSQGGGHGVVSYSQLDFGLPPVNGPKPVHVTLRCNGMMASQERDLQVVVANRTEGEIKDVNVTLVAPENWVIGGASLPGKTWEATDAREDLPGGEKDVVPFEIAAPAAQAGSYQWLTARVTCTVGGERQSFTGALGVWVASPVDISMTMLGAGSSEGGVWVDLLISVANRNDLGFAGTILLDLPQGWRVGSDKPLDFDIEEPGGITRLPVRLLADSSQRPGKFEFSARTECYSGELPAVPFEIELPIPCAKSLTPRKIDGSLADWQGAHWTSIDRQPKHKSESIPAPSSPDDMSARVSTAWDESYLYLAFDIRDDFHRAPKLGPEMWNGDSIQIGIDGMCERSVDGWDSNDHEYGVANTESGPAAWCWIAPEGEKAGPRKSIKLATMSCAEALLSEVEGLSPTQATLSAVEGRSPTQATLSAVEGRSPTQAVLSAVEGCVFEVAIPWKDVGRAKPKPGDAIGISVLVNDLDADGARKALELGGGVGLRKEPSKFLMMVLSR